MDVSSIVTVSEETPAVDTMLPGDERIQRVAIERVRAGVRVDAEDVVAAEEPLEIRIGDVSIAVTMRTPGHDDELAAGFLLTEGIISAAADVDQISHCDDVPAEARGNVVVVRLREGLAPDLERLRRNFYAASSCGVCGKASIDQVSVRARPIESGLRVAAQTLLELPRVMRDAQRVFGQTGGLHAAGLFTVGGELRCVREDIGRHNAVDKVLGWSLLDGRQPPSEQVLMISGRAGFEIVQKALVAGVPVVAAVSAPSSLAVELARRHGLTLVGFLRDDGMNVYSAAERIT